MNLIADTVILFDSGYGGNFIVNVVNEILPESGNKLRLISDINEYKSINNANIAAWHIEDFFKDNYNAVPNFSLNNYKKMLNQFVQTNSRVIVIIPTVKSRWYVDLLMRTKRAIKKDIPFAEMYRLYVEKNKYYNRRINEINCSRLYPHKLHTHFTTISRLLKSKSVYVVDLDYDKLVIHQDKEEIKKLVNFCINKEDSTIEYSVTNKIKDYHDSNIKLIKDHFAHNSADIDLSIIEKI